MAVLSADREGIFGHQSGPSDQAGGRTNQDVAIGRRFQASPELTQLDQIGAQSIHFPVSGHQLAQFRSLFLMAPLREAEIGLLTVQLALEAPPPYHPPPFS